MQDGREWLPGMCTYYLTGEGWVGDSPRIGTQDEVGWENMERG